MIVSTPFKKSNATRLWSIIIYFFYPGFLLIKLNIPRRPKACLFAFWLMPYLLGLFHWGACRVSKLGAISSNKSCKIDRIVWEMHARWSLRFPFVTECTRGYLLPIQCTKVSEDFDAMNGQWVRVHTIPNLA